MKKILSLLHKEDWEKTLIVTFCTFVTICVVTVLIFFYVPAYNSLGALASVCMDVISMAVLIMMIISITMERDEIGRTTKYFLGLMIVTVAALFFDFLTWALDGTLQYGNITYIFIVSSLCMGAILACLFTAYLSSYMDDMYNLKSVYLGAKICIIANLFAFVVTLILALTRTAFVIVDGHYEVGALYDLVMVVPIMALLYMAEFAIRNVKTIGIHDVVAVIGYIFTMIIGAMIEAMYSIGTTYVSLTISSVFIFVLLQSKLINKVRKQKDELAERIASQFEILESMSKIYSHVYSLDLEKKTVRRFDQLESENVSLSNPDNSYDNLKKRFNESMGEKQREAFLAFTDLSTLLRRMENERIISAEFYNKNEGWLRASFIRVGSENGFLGERVIFAIRNIDEEKKNIEKWIQISNTDELTGFYNRHAYENDIHNMKEVEISDDFTYVSIDINGLKVVNDSLGHEAGDELITGACECMKECFGPYGQLYRTGGDEFVALLNIDDSELGKIKDRVNEVTGKWRGKIVNKIAISCGYVTKKEVGNISLHHMAVLADERMYEAKTNYYRKQGIDRRGQRDAHIALQSLYAKILKINVTEDSYQIVNMNSNEENLKNELDSKLSSWLANFAADGKVHEDDVKEYLDSMNLKRIGEHFAESKEPYRLIYRRKSKDRYVRALLEIVPANDYQDNSQSLYLYVKDIEG